MQTIQLSAEGTRPIKVVMVGDFPRSEHRIGGGVESVMLYLARHLSIHRNIDLQIVTLDRWGLGEREIEHDGFKAHYVASTNIRGPLSRWINVQNLREKIVSTNPDVVHAHIAGQYSCAAIRSRRPFILTLHGIRFLEANLRTGLLNRIYRRHVIRREEIHDIRLAPHIISISPFIDDTFGSEIKGSISRIENPVADDFFHVPDADDSLNMLYVGRITPRKDLLTLLKGFAGLHMEFPEARLRVAGAPDDPDPTGYFDSLKSFITNSGLENSVIFLGNLSETELLIEFERAPFFVIASILETAPMSIGEAMAAGRVVIATDAGGCRYMVRHGKSGMITPIGDPSALSRAMIECARDTGLRRSMSAEARREANTRFKADVIAERTILLYREILNSK